MSGQFFIALLNPLLAFAFAIAFALFWHRWPPQRYLAHLSSAFACCGLAFVVQDFAILNYEGVSIAGNALFTAAIALSCTAALVRTRARLPWISFTIILIAGTAGFFSYLVVEFSLIGRIMVVSAVFTALTLITSILIAATRPQKASDRLVATAVFLVLLLAIGRPLFTLLGMIDIGSASGQFRDSPYWSTVQAFTPLLAIGVAGTFLAAVALDVMEQMKSEAERDFLTGLLNRRGFETAAARLLDATKPSLQPPGLLVADIDNFKRINDSFGHAMGDQVIAAVATTLANHGAATLAGRTGGEEFALYYAATRRSELQLAAETIQLALSDLRVPGLPDGHSLTLSIGLHARAGDESLPEMQIKADQALYRAKNEGKNRAILTPVPLRPVVNGP